MLPLEFIGILFIVLWIFIGFTTSEFARTPLKSSMILNTPGFLVLSPLLYQEIIKGYYRTNNFIGISSQFYFVPVFHQ